MSATSSDPLYIGEMDVSKINCATVTHDPKRSYVDLTYGNSTRNDIHLKLCEGRDNRVPLKFRLDKPVEGGNTTRRGLALKVYDGKELEILKALDERIVQEAVKNSKEWFKKTLSEEQVRARYKPIVSMYREEDDHHMLKVKVKVEDETGRSKQIPSVLHLCDEDGEIHKRCGRLDHLSTLDSTSVNPVVSTREIWFMGGGSTFGISFQVEKMIIFPGKERDELDAFGPSTAKRAKTEEQAARDGDVVVEMGETAAGDGESAM